MKDEIKEILQDVIDDIYQSGEYIYQAKKLEKVLDYITNLQEEHKNCTRKHWQQKCAEHCANEMIYKSRNEKAIEYITSYEAISTIQGLDKIEQNAKLDEKTMNIMVERYLKVHNNLLNILQGEEKDE